MCGIVGMISKNESDINLMLDSIIHRGPDSGSSINLNCEFDYKIKLGHRRLSIIDISSNSDQPFTSSINKNIIVFNGEIYNYEELKCKYLSDFIFKSSGDTEVIIELYNRYGVDSFKLLKGMFAFVIYDYSDSKVILCRDSLGIKPLYYYFDQNELYFSSEIKAISKIPHLELCISEAAITEFFLNGFVYEPNTGFENVNKVFPGTYIEVSIKKKLDIKTTKYWIPNAFSKNSKIDLENCIKNEFKRHLVADVPVGLFYSGGIDSSVLLSLSDSNLHSYFVNSKSKVKVSRDLEYAKKVADSLSKKFEIIDLSLSNNNNSDELLKNIQGVAEKSEELIADYTFYVSQLISRKAKNEGLKVMLSGMGGDELFLGYPRYKLVHFESIFKFFYFLITAKLFPLGSSFSKKIERFKAFFERKSFILRYTNLVGYFNENELSRLLLNFDDKTLAEYEIKLGKILSDYKDLKNVKKAQILDLYGFLSHNFIVADKSSMLESIEIRVPLATPDLFNYSLQTEVKYLLDLRRFKIPLLNILNKKLSLKLFRRPKEGFNPDLDNLIDVIGLTKIKEVLNDSLLLKYINESFVEELINEHMNKRKNNSYRIYQLLYFKYWLNANALKTI